MNKNRNKPTRRARVYSCKLNRRKIERVLTYSPRKDSEGRSIPEGKSNFVPGTLFGKILNNIKYIALSNGDKVVVCFKGANRIPQGIKTTNNKLVFKARGPKRFDLSLDATKMKLDDVFDEDLDVQESK